MISSHPAEIASSTRYCITGLSIIGNISFGRALLAGRNLVPNQAAGMTHFFIFCILYLSLVICITLLQNITNTSQFLNQNMDFIF
jgi:hypothetical protein